MEGRRETERERSSFSLYGSHILPLPPPLTPPLRVRQTCRRKSHHADTLPTFRAAATRANLLEADDPFFNLTPSPPVLHISPRLLQRRQESPSQTDADTRTDTRTDRLRSNSFSPDRRVLNSCSPSGGSDDSFRNLRPSPPALYQIGKLCAHSHSERNSVVLRERRQGGQWFAGAAAELRGSGGTYNDVTGREPVQTGYPVSTPACPDRLFRGKLGDDSRGRMSGRKEEVSDGGTSTERQIAASGDSFRTVVAPHASDDGLKAKGWMQDDKGSRDSAAVGISLFPSSTDSSFAPGVLKKADRRSIISDVLNTIQVGCCWCTGRCALMSSSSVCVCVYVIFVFSRSLSLSLSLCVCVCCDARCVRARNRLIDCLIG